MFCQAGLACRGGARAARAVHSAHTARAALYGQAAHTAHAHNKISNYSGPHHCTVVVLQTTHYLETPVLLTLAEPLAVQH
jgi:hypothetical protein